MTDRVGLFCKSYAGDFACLAQLLATFAAHNPDDLPLTLSLPRADLPAFRDRFDLPRNVSVVADESYCDADLAALSGWRGQQVCKLMSWRVMQADHYLVLDSDCYFIRDIAAAELRPQGRPFIACGSSIRTVLKPDNADLLAYIDGRLTPGAGHFPARPEAVVDHLDAFRHYKHLDPDNPDAVARSDVPFKAFGNTRWLFYQPGQIFSRSLLVRLVGLFERHRLTPADAILICPWEYNWYGEFAATHAFEETRFVVSPFLHFQDASDLAYARRRGLRIETFATKFPIIAMASGHLADLAY